MLDLLESQLEKQRLLTLQLFSRHYTCLLGCSVHVIGRVIVCGVTYYLYSLMTTSNDNGDKIHPCLTPAFGSTDLYRFASFSTWHMNTSYCALRRGINLFGTSSPLVPKLENFPENVNYFNFYFFSLKYLQFGVFITAKFHRFTHYIDITN